MYIFLSLSQKELIKSYFAIPDRCGASRSFNMSSEFAACQTKTFFSVLHTYVYPNMCMYMHTYTHHAYVHVPSMIHTTQTQDTCMCMYTGSSAGSRPASTQMHKFACTTYADAHNKQILQATPRITHVFKPGCRKGSICVNRVILTHGQMTT